MELFRLMGRIAIDNSQANKEIDETTGKASDSSNKMTGAFKKIGTAVATYLTVDAIVGFGKSCVEAAADANAAESQFSQVFGNLEGEARKSLSGIADESGISENRMKGSFTKIAAFAKTTGMDTESALGLSERAMVAVADSAAFYDRSLEDTTESLQSFLKGNYENDAALGLSCTEVTRNEAANKLYGKSFKELSESQKQLTLLQMVEDANKASGALGQAARESDTWTNVTGNLKQSWTDFQAVIGAAVLPKAVEIVKKLASGVADLAEKTKEAIEWAKEHETIMTIIGIAMGTVTAAIIAYNIAQNAAAIATAVSTAATTAFGAVMAFVTSPITLVVAAIGALIAIGVLLYKNWDEIKAKAVELWNNLKQKFEDIKQAISEKVEAIKKAISEKFEAAKQKAIDIFENVKKTLSTIWNGIKNVVQVAIMFIVEVIKGAFALITLPFRMIWENCKDVITSAWNAIKKAVSTALNAIKSTISKAWNAIKNVITPILNKIKSTISNVWNAVKNTISNILNNIKSKFSTIWNAIKTAVTNAINAVKSKIQTVMNSVKSVVTSALNAVKSKFSSIWNGIKTSVGNAINGVKSKISSGLNGAKSVVSNVLGSIKSKFTSIFNSVKTIVGNAISNIKSKFNFKWSLPKLKLPHPQISGKFSLNPPSVPKFSIKWYKDAMDSPKLLNDPTIFGYSAATGKFLGGGEAGSEMVGGTSKIMNMISDAVASQNEAVAYYLQKIIAVLAEYFPQIIKGMDRPIRWNPDEAAAVMAAPMDKYLGKIQGRKDRGR